MDGQLTPLAIPIAEAQRMLGGISRTSVYGLAKGGQLKKIRIGRRGLIVVASINAFVDRLAETPATDPQTPPYTGLVDDDDRTGSGGQAEHVEAVTPS
jgi:hypothetical protein